MGVELTGWRAEMELAAKRLEDRAKRAAADLEQDGYWQGYEELTAWQDGFVNGMGGVCSELAGILTPLLAIEIVRAMRAEIRSSVLRHTVSPHLLTFARGINEQVEAGEAKR